MRIFISALLIFTALQAHAKGARNLCEFPLQNQLSPDVRLAMIQLKNGFDFKHMDHQNFAQVVRYIFNEALQGRLTRPGWASLYQYNVHFEAMQLIEKLYKIAKRKGHLAAEPGLHNNFTRFVTDNIELPQYVEDQRDFDPALARNTKNILEGLRLTMGEPSNVSALPGHIPGSRSE